MTKLILTYQNLNSDSIKRQKMINDISIDKILQRQENGNLFIVHVIATPDMLSIEIEDKMKGEIWAGEFSLQQIQEITLKAKNPKKFQVFIKMLMSSLLGQTESVLIQILTYSELERKMNLASRGRNIQNNKKYLIMTYMSEFDKAHYPLGLNYLENPTVQRLRITIRRLAQQLALNEGQRGQNYDVREHSILKYENQTLKARIKNLQQKLQVHSQDSENIMDKSNLMNEQKQTKKQLQQAKLTLSNKQQQIQQLKTKIRQLTAENDKKANLIIDLKQQIAEYKEEKIENRQQQQTYTLLEQKINQMNKQTKELVSQLQFSKEKQKKNLLKIENLEKQLQKMMALQQKKRVGGVNPKINSNLEISRKSVSVKSQKSFTSQKSQKSNKSNLSKSKGGLQTYLSKPASNNVNNKKSVTKRSSVYDSDTESSKLRRANNSRVSPYRQTSKPSGNASNSSKRASNNFTNTMNRFDRNILTNNRERSRSKSRSVKKQNSPPIEIPTDNFASSSEDDRNRNDVLIKLMERKNRVKLNDGREKNKNQISKRDAMGPIQRKITDIAEMLRKAKSRQGRD